MAFERLRRFFDENGERLDAIVATFGTYQPQPVTRDKLWRWLKQFDERDCELLTRVLEQVQYYDIARTNALLRELHHAVMQELAHDGIAEMNQMIFVPAGGAGESAQDILRRYRDVNRLLDTDARLLLAPELQQHVVAAQNAGTVIGIVFLDDFIGTGVQIRNYWHDVLVQLIPPPIPPVYLATVAACDHGVLLVQNETPLKVITAHYIPDTAYLSGGNFTENEKSRLRDYCADVENYPLGFGDLELLLAFAYSCPDNSISLLRGSIGQKEWKGILPRFDDM